MTCKSLFVCICFALARSTIGYPGHHHLELDKKQFLPEMTAELPTTKSTKQQNADSFRAMLSGMASATPQDATNDMPSSNYRMQDMSSNMREHLVNGNWEYFTPPPISNPDCHVEVQVVQKVPGRCIRLGRSDIPACQTQNLLAVNNEECNSLERHESQHQSPLPL